MEVYDLEKQPVETLKTPRFFSRAVRLASGWANLVDCGPHSEEAPLTLPSDHDQFEETGIAATFPEIAARGENLWRPKTSASVTP